MHTGPTPSCGSDVITERHSTPPPIPHLVQHLELNDQGACVVRCRTHQIPAPHVVGCAPPPTTLCSILSSTTRARVLSNAAHTRSPRPMS